MGNIITNILTKESITVKETKKELVYFLTGMLLIFRIMSSYSAFLQNPFFTILAAVIIYNILRLGGVFGLAITFFDMTAWGNFFSPEQFGIPGLFKFIDVEVILLIAVSIIYYKRSSIKAIDPLVYKIFKYIFIIGTTYAVLSIVFWHSDVGGVFRVFRTFIYASLIFYTPFFIKNRYDVYKLVKYLVIIALINSIIYLTQVLQPKLPIYQYAQIVRLGAGLNQIRVYGMMLLIVVAVIPSYFAYLLQEKTNWKTKTIFIILLLTSLITAGRTLLVITLLSFFLIIFLNKNRTKGILNFIYITIFGIAFIILMSVANVKIFSDVLNRYGYRNIGIMNDLDMGGGTFTMRALQFLAVPQFLNTPEKKTFGAGFLYKQPQEYGPLYPFIYAINYANGNYYQEGVLTRNVGSAAENVLKVSIFFADNGWAGIFASMGYLGIFLYSLFILLFCVYMLRNYKRSKDILIRSIFIGLFCLFLFDPISFFFSAGYLDPPSMLHLVIYISLSIRVKQFEDSNTINTVLAN